MLQCMDIITVANKGHNANLIFFLKRFRFKAKIVAAKIKKLRVKMSVLYIRAR